MCSKRGSRMSILFEVQPLFLYLRCNMFHLGIIGDTAVVDEP